MKTSAYYIFVIVYVSVINVQTHTNYPNNDWQLHNASQSNWSPIFDSKRFCAWESNGRCYNLVEHNEAFYAAWAYCTRVYGGYLVSMSTEEEFQFLKNKLFETYGSNSNKVIWIGAAHYEGEWIWTNGEAWTQSQWSNGEPSGQGGFAASHGSSHDDWQWKEQGEFEEFYFLCES